MLRGTPARLPGGTYPPRTRGSSSAPGGGSGPLPAASHRAPEHLWMGQIADHQRPYAFRVLDREHPCDRPTPIMAHDVRALLARVPDQRDDVLLERLDVVRSGLLRLVV